MLLGRWIFVIELLNIFSFTFAPLELQSPLLSKLRPRTLNDFFPVLLKEFWLHYFPLSEITHLYVSSASSSHPEPSKIFPGSEKQRTELHSTCRYDREPDPGSFPPSPNR